MHLRKRNNYFLHFIKLKRYQNCPECRTPSILGDFKRSSKQGHQLSSREVCLTIIPRRDEFIEFQAILFVRNNNYGI